MKGLHKAFFSELIGTGLLVGIGLSVVIVMFGTNSPLISLLPDPGLRRLITGFLFGTTGALIAISQVGKVSGAHINPAVTSAFWILGKIDGVHAVLYVTAQCAGAIIGAVLLLWWGDVGKSIGYGATIPGPGFGIGVALAGEVVTTFALVLGLFLFIGNRRLAIFTPLLFPFLYAIMVYLEAPISGTSTNPARSLGPAVISGEWHGWWIYLAGPITGTWIATIVQRHSLLRRLEIRVAKIYHFKHDPHGIFHPRR
jgi:aquaporin Z